MVEKRLSWGWQYGISLKVGIPTYIFHSVRLALHLTYSLSVVQGKQTIVSTPDMLHANKLGSIESIHG